MVRNVVQNLLRNLSFRACPGTPLNFLEPVVRNIGSKRRWVHPEEIQRTTPAVSKNKELDFAMCVRYVLVQGSPKEISEIYSIFISYPQELRNLSFGTCPGTFPEPVLQNLPGTFLEPAGTFREPAPGKPPRSLYWQRPHSSSCWGRTSSFILVSWSCADISILPCSLVNNDQFLRKETYIANDIKTNLYIFILYSHMYYQSYGNTTPNGTAKPLRQPAMLGPEPASHRSTDRWRLTQMTQISADLRSLDRP